MYFGLSARMQTLYVSFFSLALLRNEFTSCAVLNSPGGGNGNAYGGGVSVYMGAYSTPNLGNGSGNTMVQNVSIVVDMVSFTTCSVSNTPAYVPGGGNTYGGGVSVYMGAYAVGISVSKTIVAAGDTTVQNVSIVVHKVAFTSCNVSTGTNSPYSSGNTYGGSLSFYVGAYTWSFKGLGSNSGLTTATVLSLTINDTNSTDCSAVVQGNLQNLGANSYGGSISAVYIGAYAWNLNPGDTGNPGSIYGVSNAFCGDTSVTDLVISITGSTFINSLAASRKFSTGYVVFEKLTLGQTAGIPFSSVGSNVSALHKRPACKCDAF